MALDRRCAGFSTGSLLLMLLLLVAGGGAWNYHRNWQLEQQSDGARPYESYGASDLEALRSAYESELKRVRVHFAHAQSQRARVTGDLGSIAENVDQYARTARKSATIRAAAGEVAEREAQIAQLEKELQLRARYGQSLERHWRLLTTF